MRRGDPLTLQVRQAVCKWIASPACAGSQVRVWSFPSAGSSFPVRTAVRAVFFLSIVVGQFLKKQSFFLDKNLKTA